jgi:hypothetical protein
MGAYMALRAIFCIASNLTTSELIKRRELSHFNHESAGYCNRFDRGAGHNCLQFWFEPDQDWWAEYEAGDRVSAQVTQKMMLTSH